MAQTMYAHMNKWIKKFFKTPKKQTNKQKTCPVQAMGVMTQNSGPPLWAYTF
jgi:hypothetical protein